MRVVLADQAARSYHRLGSSDRQRIAAALAALAEEARPAGKHVKAMAGLRDRFLRYRVGDLRLMYEVHDQDQVVLILAIIRRRDLRTWLRRRR